MIVTIDMTKAKAIHKDKIREARVKKLAELDVDFQRALETGASTTDIVTKKTSLKRCPC